MENFRMSILKESAAMGKMLLLCENKRSYLGD